MAWTLTVEEALVGDDFTAEEIVVLIESYGG
jgi:hypothetical protein